MHLDMALKNYFARSGPVGFGWLLCIHESFNELLHRDMSVCVAADAEKMLGILRGGASPDVVSVRLFVG